MRHHLVGGALIAASVAAGAQPSGPSGANRVAYEYALRCFVVNSAYGNEASARLAFGAAMRLGQLQNLSNRQVNDDLNSWSATEMLRTARDRRYREQLLGECRRLGMAS